MRSGDTALVVEPGYPEQAPPYAPAGARVLQWRAVERTGHKVDLDQIGELMLLEKPALVALCAPATPSGAGVPFEQLHALATRFPETALRASIKRTSRSAKTTRTSTCLPPEKHGVHSIARQRGGLSGVRVGYLIAHPAIAARIEACVQRSAPAQPHKPWPSRTRVTPGFLRESRTRMLADRARMGFVLQKLGLVTTPSVASFQLVRIARAAEVAAELLERHHVHVRECSASGLPDNIRFSGLLAEHEQRVEAALREVTERRKLRHGRDA